MLHEDTLTLPDDKIVPLSKLKAFADDRIDVAYMVQYFWDRVKTFLENEKILVTSIFAFSYNVFERLKWCNFSEIGLKTLQGKEKMLDTSIFSFSHNVFIGLSQGRENPGLFCKELWPLLPEYC